MKFEVTHGGGAPGEGGTAARCGLLRLPHGDVETPAFLPVEVQITAPCGRFKSNLADLATFSQLRFHGATKLDTLRRIL